jgi:hypothetical protein
MSWKIEIPIIVRTWINDLSDTPTYSNDRVLQLITVAAQYVTKEVNLDNEYSIDIINKEITPDPTTLGEKDVDFIGFVSLKASCILDQSTIRTKAASEGIRASLGPANLSVNGSLRGYELMLSKGPCYLYEQLKTDYEIGNANVVRAVLSPFVGNNFDSRYLDEYGRESLRSRYFYS